MLFTNKYKSVIVMLVRKFTYLITIVCNLSMLQAPLEQSTPRPASPERASGSPELAALREAVRLLPKLTEPIYMMHHIQELERMMPDLNEEALGGVRENITSKQEEFVQHMILVVEEETGLKLDFNQQQLKELYRTLTVSVKPIESVEMRTLTCLIQAQRAKEVILKVALEQASQRFIEAETRAIEAEKRAREQQELNKTKSELIRHLHIAEQRAAAVHKTQIEKHKEEKHKEDSCSVQ